MVKNPPANAGDMGLIPELRIFPGEGNGNPLQYSYLGNPMDRGAWCATVHGVTRVHDLATQQQQINPWLTSIVKCDGMERPWSLKLTDLELICILLLY